MKTIKVILTAMSKKQFRIAGIVVLILGILLLVYLGVITMWGEIEASFFNAGLRSNKPLRSLDCPAVITPTETAYVSGTFDNPSDRLVDMEIRTYVSAGYLTLMNEYITNFTLQPGETKRVEVPVTAEEAVYGRIVMVRMHQMKRVPFPYLNAACGIVVVRVGGLTGPQFVALSLGLGSLLSAGGIALWAINAKPVVWDRLKVFRAMVFLAVAALSIPISSLINLWGLSILLLVVWILMGIGMIWQFATTSRKEDYLKMADWSNQRPRHR
jgi:hypothetical protein